MTTRPNQPPRDRRSDFGLPRTEFRPINNGSSGWRVFFIMLSLALFIGAGVAYYWFFLSPASNELLGAVSLTQEEATEEKDTEEALEATNYEALEDDQPQDVAPAPSTTYPTRGTITHIHTPQGQYYVIVNSFIDGDLATDYAKKLRKQGIDTTILAPKQGEYFFRVAVTQAGTLYAANKKAQELKATYGNDIWVKKY